MIDMTKGFKDSKGKFHPINNTKPSSKKKSINPTGVKQKHMGVKRMQQLQVKTTLLTNSEMKDWEKAVHASVIGVHKGEIDGYPTTELVFDNGEEWFEFKDLLDEGQFLDVLHHEPSNRMNVLIKLSHPLVEGYMNFLNEDGQKERIFKEREDESSVKYHGGALEL